MDDLLIFKLVATPVLLAAATFASRRWGETIGGFLVGLPLTSGPISVFLALEYGADFARQAAAGSLYGTIAQAAFCYAYFRFAPNGWPVAIACATSGFFAAALLTRASGVEYWQSFVLTLIAVGLVLWRTPNDRSKSSTIAIPWWDLPFRMVLLTFLVISVTLIAPYIGATSSGIIASFPFIATILAIFSHRSFGPAAAQRIVRGMVTGLLGFSTFFVVLSFLLDRSGLVTAYLLATVGTFAVQAIVLIGMNRQRFR